MPEFIVTVEQGKIRGKISSDYYGGSFLSFLGIPYAKAPVGELRFKAPQPPEQWTNVRDGTKEGPECPSTDMYFGYYVGNEDNCLNLNVYTKEIPTEDSIKKPVMVWIHGGGFVYGANKQELYGPGYLMTQDIVLVSINYRLGIFGFLSLKDPSLDIPGNTGLKDQTFALKWVQRNIEKFGGDPKNVTIFGESAGSASVHYLTLSPLTKGLFQKAIMQSGSALNNWAWGKNNAAEVAKCFGYKQTDEKFVLEKLRMESARSIVNGQFRIEDAMAPKEVRPWGPVVEPPSEDAFLTETPLEIIKSGKNHQIPVIFGYNTAEGMLFALIRKIKPSVKLPQNFEKEIPYELKLEMGSEESKNVADKIRQYYMQGEECTEDNIDSLYRLKTDSTFVYGIQRAIKLQNQSSTQPIYVYRMTLEGPLNYFKKIALTRYFKSTILVNFFTKLSGNYLSPMKSVFQGMNAKIPGRITGGVCHADDLFYLFPNFFTPKINPGSIEDIYIQRFVKLWTNFATTGNPTPEPNESLKKFVWRPVESDNFEVLDIGEVLKMTPNLEAERMKFWEELYQKY